MHIIHRANEEKPHQLWADLQCPDLWVGLVQDPVRLAIAEVRYREAQKRQGIVRLDECHIVAELPHA